MQDFEQLPGRFENSEFAKDASKIGTAYNSTLTEIRNDPNLSDAGKRAQIADAYEASKARMDRLRDTTKLDCDNRTTTLQRRLFGTAGHAAHEVISHRDASDRAAAVANEDEAVRMMSNAVASGDSVLQGALLKRAYDERNPINGNPWMNVINTYEKARPTEADDLQELLNLRTRRDNGFAQTAYSAI